MRVRAVLSWAVVVACSKSEPPPAPPVASGSTLGSPPAPTGAATASRGEARNDPPNDAPSRAPDDAPAVVSGPPPPPDAPPWPRDLDDDMIGGLLVGEDPDAGDGSARRPVPPLGTQVDPEPERPATGSSAGATPRGRITIARKEALDDTTLTVEAVWAKLQTAYMPGLQRCYRETLKTEPAARGRLALQLTVDATGRTVKPTAAGFAARVDDCVRRLAGSWRFPVPKDVDGVATDATFSLVLQLAPD